jgi:DNA-binding XRE family transcriptional regulator
MDIEWFKKRKRELGVTDADVAETLGVERSVANRVMNGRVAMNFRRAKQMANLFQVPVDELFFRLGVADRQSVGAAVKNSSVSGDIPVWGKVATGVWLEETFIEPDDDCRPSVPYDRMPGDMGHEGLFGGLYTCVTQRKKSPAKKRGLLSFVVGQLFPAFR